MHAYIINMDGQADRWDFVSSLFAATTIPFTRVSAVVGRHLSLPIPQYSPSRYRLFHGQNTNLSAIGCYLSHIKCLSLFLQSTHSHALIAEDDAQPTPNLLPLLRSAIAYQSTWDILRLSGFHNPHPIPFASLNSTHTLAIGLTRLCGSAAYLVTRSAASILLKNLVPMFLPFDHALDREWAYHLRSAILWPLPISQQNHRFTSQTIEPTNHHLPWYSRYITVLPWRTLNESSRILFRTKQLLSARRLARTITP